jgi:hypothetical protein
MRGYSHLRPSCSPYPEQQPFDPGEDPLAHLSFGGDESDRELVRALAEKCVEWKFIDASNEAESAADRARVLHRGFTMTTDAHGFGPHGSALAAKELGASLIVEGAGARLGTLFRLALPGKPKGSAA